MRKSKIEKEIERGLRTLAFGDVSDAVSLLFMSEEEAVDKIPSLNLFNISEIKRPRGGGMEIKFFDRIKACEKLKELIPERSDSAKSLFEALQKSADRSDEDGV